jgi:hypothetical protein
MFVHIGRDGLQEQATDLHSFCREARLTGIVSNLRGNAWRYIVEGIGIKHARHQHEICKASA